MPRRELYDLFVSFCAFGATRRPSYSVRYPPELDNARFAKFCRDCGLIDDDFTTTEADLLFAKMKPIGHRKITWAVFRKILEEIARFKQMHLAELEQAVVAAGGPKTSLVPATRSSSRGAREVTGSVVAPLKGENLPDKIGRVLPWESPNWACHPRPPGSPQAGWRPAGNTNSPAQKPEMPPLDIQSLLSEYGLRRRATSPRPGGHLGSVGSPLGGRNLPTKVGRVLPWESPNWQAAPSDASHTVRRRSPSIPASPRQTFADPYKAALNSPRVLRNLTNGRISPSRTLTRQQSLQPAGYY
eukprot:Sspe_Gene.34372::Locus_16713_Transcript_1_1_Confidence_1.000_Length_1199::g.34372::m.34372